MKEGLRERKKRQMHETIARVAMKLFHERGYDNVTVAEVARAADVSEKTVFNYFPTKEDLVLREGASRRAALIEAIRNRAPGEPLAAPFRRMTMDFLDRVEREPVESIVAVPRVVVHSHGHSLRNRLFMSWEQEAAELSPVIAHEAGAAEGDLAAEVAARLLAWTHRLVFRAAFTRLLAGDDRREVAADLRKQARRAYDLVERGLEGYAVKR